MNKIRAKLKRFFNKAFRIKWCYLCNKCIFWSKKTLRVSESPANENGVKVPACKDCIFKAEEYYI